MAQQERKQLLMVDDSEIDRIILKSILANEFDILEATNGNMAFEYVTKWRDRLDAVMLDIAMPGIDGFDVLRFMENKGITDIPVFLVSAEPTRTNVEKAMEYHIADFIGKPFDRGDVLRRLRSKLGVSPVFDLNDESIKETWAYISELESFFQSYLNNYGKTDEHYRVMVDLMRILLNQYNRNLRDNKLPQEAIELISKAAYFCDIGTMLIPDRRLQALTLATGGETQISPEMHTLYGSQIVRLNRAKSCEFFVEVCASMCLHHHERYDGHGYPNGLVGKMNGTYNQMCLLVDEFDQLRSKFYGDKSKPVRHVLRRLMNESGLVSPKLFDLLDDAELLIIDYFTKVT